MASGNYIKRKRPVTQMTDIQPVIRRTTRLLEAVPGMEFRDTDELHLEAIQTRTTTAFTVSRPAASKPAISPLARHLPWLRVFLICLIMVIVGTGVLIGVGISQRSNGSLLLPYSGGKVYDIQVGGELANTWQTKQPIKPKVELPKQTGPYSVLGKPTITADFINKVLQDYGSPAAGKGKALYDLGVQYGIDPVYALAFFLHESGFGTQGEARVTHSLGNLRCIPNYDCIDQDRGGYASFPSWEEGFKAWYALIRNLYVAQWGKTTIDQIIPTYAPRADNNDEKAYINAVKHSVDTWRAGTLRP